MMQNVQRNPSCLHLYLKDARMMQVSGVLLNKYEDESLRIGAEKHTHDWQWTESRKSNTDERENGKEKRYAINEEKRRVSRFGKEWRREKRDGVL
ncbi:hypothetical protein MRB53_029830 [Persea americana]|uniref:Uncharacterized protein n=1 Tax=Persea americana TaxID=3435 RepID=A0ACC2KJM7_PERAE|nr:hypothetical protein MRB53_029830 [Persea americana]